jgi:hypothetical protein
LHGFRSEIPSDPERELQIWLLVLEQRTVDDEQQRDGFCQWWQGKVSWG